MTENTQAGEKVTVHCPSCGAGRLVSPLNVERSRKRLCRVCAHAWQKVPVKTRAEQPARPKPLKATASVVPILPRTYTEEPDLYCGAPTGMGHYCRRHYPCAHHPDAS